MSNKPQSEKPSAVNPNDNWERRAIEWDTPKATLTRWNTRFREAGISVNWDNPDTVWDGYSRLRKAGGAPRTSPPDWLSRKVADSRRATRPDPTDGTAAPSDPQAATFQRALTAANTHFDEVDALMVQARAAKDSAEISNLTKPWTSALETLRKAEIAAGGIMERQQATLDKEEVRRTLLELNNAVRKRLKIEITQFVINWIQANPGAPAVEIGRGVEDAIEAATQKLNEVELSA